jgi:hypothetical protein
MGRKLKGKRQNKEQGPRKKKKNHENETEMKGRNIWE